MDSCPFSLKWPPLLVSALLVVSSVGAEPPATNAWQSIIFSSPTNTEISSNLTSHSTQPSSPSSFQNKLRLFQDQSPVTIFDNLPAGPVPTPGVERRLRKSSNNNGDWMFMTPAEIMGVSPDQFLQTENRDTNSSQGSLSPLERYLEGQNPSAKVQAGSPYNSSSAQNPWTDENGETNGALSDLISSGLGNLKSTTFNPSLNNASNGAPNDNLFGTPNVAPSWSKLLGFSSPQPAPNPAQQQQQRQQQGEMDQFMQLLNPNFASIAAATTSPNATTLPQPQTTVPPPVDSTEPLANPIGASFAPLSSGMVGKPAGLTPLPGITQQANAQSVAPPAWAPQPPPWMSSTPQPFSVPQRKF